jgi:Uma2 family endonuclease
MLNYNLPKYLPSAEELPDSNDTPVDNELQELMPGLLKSILLILWADKIDWFFGINMGIYYHPDEPPLVPDSFLSLAVERFYDEELRPSYVLWDENVTPCLVLEVVSQHYRHEYTAKLEQYAELGILYYVIYSSRRRRKPRLEVYKLVIDSYEFQPGNPVWLPEIDLGIGCERGNYSGVTREWLYWYDKEGKRYPTPQEKIQQEIQRTQKQTQRAQQAEQLASQVVLMAQQMEQRAQQAEQRAQQAEELIQLWAEQLNALGIDIDNLG